MAGTPKPGTPPYLWVNLVYELQAYLEPTKPLYNQVDALLRNNKPLVCLDTAAFCAAEPPAAVQPTLANFTDGSWVQIMKDYALNSVYSRICE